MIAAIAAGQARIEAEAEVLDSLLVDLLGRQVYADAGLHERAGRRHGT